MASALGASPWPPTHPPHHHRCTQTVDPCRRRAAPVMVGCICAEDEGGPPPVFASSLRPCCCSSSLSPHLAVQQPGQGEGAARPGSISLLHAGELDEQVAREAATASGGAAQERPPPGLHPVSRSLSVSVFFFFLLARSAHRFEASCCRDQILAMIYAADLAINC
ncbi:hypothetical protein VPH35_007730 [Triticum aestivum]